MFLFFQTIDYNKPKWQLDRSLIGTNPGLGFRPTPPDTHIDSTLIWYKRQASNYALWVQKLDDFLQDYREPSFLPGGGQNIIQCSDGNKPPPGKVCAVNIHQLNPCIKETGYNYDKGSPCIFLKLNKIYGWEPAYYNDTKNLPAKMPADLKNFIIQEKNREPYKKLETVWVSCEGENPADIENIGPISYLPSRGFPGYYFPYINTEGYLSPVIAVWFESPARGVLINIECKAWAQNIHHDRHERRGSVHFELMID
ncbi:unnamed protein product [Bemisia tabaci]|nr:unnamed protein product [Bemisia tabaci]